MEQKKSSFISPGTLWILPSWSDYGVMPPWKPQEIQTSPAFRDTGSWWGRNQASFHPLIKASGFSLGNQMLFWGGVYPDIFIHFSWKYQKPRSKQQKTSGDMALNELIIWPCHKADSTICGCRSVSKTRTPTSKRGIFEPWVTGYRVGEVETKKLRFFYVFTNEILLSYGYLSLYHGKLGTYNLHF